MSRRVAVVILNWNGKDILRRFLPSVVANTPADLAEVVVADNGSADGSIEMLRADFPTVRVICLDKNYGYAGGYNRAVAKVDSEYVVLLNSDVDTPAGWLQPLVEYMDLHSDTGACQPKILSVGDPQRFEYAGAAGGFLDRNGYPFCRGRIFSTIETDSHQYDEATSVDWASGAALMVRRAIFERLGGFDERFFAHMEEIDLCWRMRLAGYDVAAVGSSAVLHLGGGALAMGDPRKTYLNFRNSLLMMHKNLPSAGRRKALIRRRLLDTIAWARFVATLKFSHANAILRAHRDYRRALKDDIGGVAPSVNLLKSRPNILSAYYLRRHKQFSDIPADRCLKSVSNNNPA